MLSFIAFELRVDVVRVTPTYRYYLRHDLQEPQDGKWSALPCQAIFKLSRPFPWLISLEARLGLILASQNESLCYEERTSGRFADYADMRLVSIPPRYLCRDEDG